MDFNYYFSYIDGRIYWKNFYNESQTRSVMIGDVAGYSKPDDRGYLRVQVAGKMLRVHRVIWEMHNGCIPEGMEIDHVNGIKSDNSIENLRVVPSSVNSKNKSIYKSNKTGVCGVELVKKNGKFRASIRVKGKLHFRGEYLSFDDAVNARRAAEVEFDFHENHGRAK